MAQVIADEIVEDGSGHGFVCCGHIAEGKRSLKQDRFRHCFKGATTDSSYDYDDRDMADVMAVLSGAWSADQNRIYSGYPDSFFNEPYEGDLDMSDRARLLEEIDNLKRFINARLGEGTAPHDEVFPQFNWPMPKDGAAKSAKNGNGKKAVAEGADAEAGK